MLLDANPVPLAAPSPAGPPVRVQIGIDAAITANHHVAVRRVSADGTATTTRFMVAPTLAGLKTLSGRLADCPGALAVAEPTSMTWSRTVEGHDSAADASNAEVPRLYEWQGWFTA